MSQFTAWFKLHHSAILATLVAVGGLPWIGSTGKLVFQLLANVMNSLS